MNLQTELSKPPIKAAPNPAPQQPTEPKPMIGAIAALVVALVSISLSAILVKFSELEVGPYATAFNRFWITALILGAWNVFHVDDHSIGQGR